MFQPRTCHLCLSQMNVGHTAKTISLLCVIMFLKGMGFNYKSWLVCMRGIRAYKQRRPWTFPVLSAWGCVSGMLQGSDVPCHNSSEEANPNCSGIGSFSLSCLPKLWCSPCRYTEQMSRSSHREGHPSPRGVHQLQKGGQKSFLPTFA